MDKYAMLKVIEEVVIDTDYDLWKEIFEYYEDHKGTGNEYDRRRNKIENSCIRALERIGIYVE